MSQRPLIFDPRRLRGIVFIGLTLAGFLLALNFAIFAIAGPAPGKATARTIPMTWEVTEEMEERAAGLAAAYRADRGDKRPFLVYVGLSSAWEGVDPAGLAAQDGWNARIVPVCGKGGSGSAIQGLADLSAPILRRHLCPTLTILCIHPMWLANRTDEGTLFPPASLNPLPLLLRRDWNEALDRLAWWNWISKNTVYANRIAVSGQHDIRVALGLFPQIDPWSAPKRMGLPAHAEARFLKTQMAGIEAAGVFDPGVYSKDGEQLVVLNDLIARFRRAGSPVMIVLMPEMSPLRARVPAKARQVLTESLQGNPNASSVPVLDFGGALDDDDFSDYAHLNDRGRAALTKLLANAIRDQRQGYPHAGDSH